MKKLIINADDFGYTPGVTAGIIEAHKNGIVTSTTALTVSPHFKEAMEMAAKVAPTLAIGVHLTLTLRHGVPILPAEKVQSLIGADGTFLSQKEIPLVANLDEVEAEWDAQITKFFESGRRPDHIDAHHNIHGGSEGLLSVAVKLAKKYNLPLRNCERKPEQVGMVEKMYGAVKRPDKMHAEFYGEGANVETFTAILKQIVASEHEVFEMNCHTAFIDYKLQEQSSYCAQRPLELKFLTSDEAKKLILQNEIMLTNYEVLQ